MTPDIQYQKSTASLKENIVLSYRNLLLILKLNVKITIPPIVEIYYIQAS
jgi:hypothetical protein